VSKRSSVRLEHSPKQEPSRYNICSAYKTNRKLDAQERWNLSRAVTRRSPHDWRAEHGHLRQLGKFPNPRIQTRGTNRRQPDAHYSQRIPL